MASITQAPAQQIRHAVREHGRSFEWLARAGYATQAFLYFTIGGLAALAAFGYGGHTTDGKGALLELYRQPFGRVLLVLAAIGLFGFALFRGYQAIIDPEHRARGWRALKRVGWLAVAVIYAGLGVFAIKLASGNGDSGGSPSEHDTCCHRSGRGPLPPEAPRPGPELRAARNWSGGQALRQDHGQTKRKKTRVFCSKATGSSTGTA